MLTISSDALNDRELLKELEPGLEAFSRWMSDTDKGGPLTHFEMAAIKTFILWSTRGPGAKKTEVGALPPPSSPG